MRRIGIIATAWVLALGLGYAVASEPSGTEAPGSPAKVTNYGTKPAVTFDHAKHQAVECVQCHHAAKEGKFKCGDCHKAAEEGGAPKIKDAFHKKGVGVCYSCHLDKDAQHKLKCSDCHSE